MASDDKEHEYPNFPRSSRRKSVRELFEELDVNDPQEGSSSEAAGPFSEPSRQGTILSSAQFTTATATTASTSKKSLLRATFRKGWPPSFRAPKQSGSTNIVSEQTILPSFTLKMSDLYRVYGDNWATDPRVEDKPLDVSKQFAAVSEMMDEIQQLIQKSTTARTEISDVLLNDMAAAIFGSNKKARKGLELDETIKLCMLVFNGETDIQFSERTEDYQKALEKLIHKNIAPEERQVIRSRREVIQHAAAFQHIINKFVRQNQPLNEELIKETHGILLKGISAGAAGVLSSKAIGGIYRTQDVYVGTHRFPKPSKIPQAMNSMVKSLCKDLEEAERSGKLDPFAIAAKYCDLFVNIHPFRDGNGRICRLILNAILIKYAGIVVNVGEHDQSRDEYIQAARESREVGGHAGALATLVLKEAERSYRKIRDIFRAKDSLNH